MLGTIIYWVCNLETQNDVTGNVTFYRGHPMSRLTYCYKLVQGFRVMCFITGQYNTKGYGTITDVICEWLDQDLLGRIQVKFPPTIFSLAFWFWGQPWPIVHCSILVPSY